MEDVVLERLLIQADADAPRPQIAGDLSARVRHRLRRRKTSARIAAGVALALFVGVAVVWQHSSHERGLAKQLIPELNQRRLDQLRSEALQLASDAAVHERVADALLQSRQQTLRRQAWRRALAVAPQDPVSVVDEARDRTAEILVRDADRMPADSRNALQTYRLAAELFPQTPAGKEALHKLKSEGV